jgi:outer membrane receptor protein involved in Fe transport
VAQPLNLSVDYYNVDLTNAISQQGIDGVYRRCFAQQYNPSYELNEFCALVGRTPGTGEVANVSITYSNAGPGQTSGIDAQLNWSLDLEEIGTGLPGTFITSVQTTYLLNFETTTDDGHHPARRLRRHDGQRAGRHQRRVVSLQGVHDLHLRGGGATFSLQWQYKSASIRCRACSTPSSNITGAPAYNLFNLNGTYRVTPDVRFRWGVDNLLDKARR